MQTITSGRATTTNVWIVGTHPLVARYLLNVLEKDSVIHAAWMETTAPDYEWGTNLVFVLDTGVPDMPIARHLQSLTQGISSAKYVVLGQRLDVQAVCRLLCMGVHGFLTYDQVSEFLTLAVRAVQNGGMWVDSQVLQKYMRLDKREKHYRVAHADVQGLTAREEELLHLTRQRLSNKEIASLLHIEVSTVKFHLSNIYSKLQIASRSDLWEKLCQSSMPQGTEATPFTANGRSVQGVGDKENELRAEAS